PTQSLYLHDALPIWTAGQQIHIVRKADGIGLTSKEINVHLPDKKWYVVNRVSARRCGVVVRNCNRNGGRRAQRESRRCRIQQANGKSFVPFDEHIVCDEYVDSF